MKHVYLGLLAFLLPASASAAFVINLGGREISNVAGAVPNIRNDAVTLTFENDGTDKVLLTMRATDVTGGTGSEWWWSKGKTILFNSDTEITDFEYIDTGAESVEAKSFEYKENDISFTGGGKFDVKFEFKTNGPDGTFYPPLHSTYRLTGSGLTEDSFKFTTLVQANSDENLLLFGGMHINLPPGGFESGKYGSTGGGDDFTDVPEPASAALWALGCCAGAMVRRRKKKALA